MNNVIWEKDSKTNKFNKVSTVWNFIALAKSCESIDEKNIYFAQNKEYYLMGGIDEEPTIRIFDLYNKQPWRDSDLGIVPNMNWTKQWCVFYDQLMVNINLKTGFVIIAIYEILYWLIFQLTGQYIYSDEDFYQMLLWVIAVPLVAIVIYFLIRWASKK